MVSSSSSLERGGRLGRWIRGLLVLRLVSALVSRLRPNEVWTMDMASSLYTLAFILHLSWMLLSRHVLPFRVQDYSASGLLMACPQFVCCDTRDTIVACLSQCRCAVWSRVQGVSGRCRVFLARIRQAMVRNRGEGGAAFTESGHPLLSVEITQQATNLPEESLAAPMLNFMERVENVPDQGREEEKSPELRDKKKW